MKNKHPEYMKFILTLQGIPQGYHFYSMSVDGQIIDTKKMILVK
jgi:hypothetical protein